MGRHRSVGARSVASPKDTVAVVTRVTRAQLRRPDHRLADLLATLPGPIVMLAMLRSGKVFDDAGKGRGGERMELGATAARPRNILNRPNGLVC